jgi:hypothetical protein
MRFAHLLAAISTAAAGTNVSAEVVIPALPVEGPVDVQLRLRMEDRQ